MPSPDDLEFENRAQWRGWLEQHHAGQPEAWLVLFKKNRGQGLTLDEAVEEALCFGWIDGKLLPLDERRFALRFSPRKPNSVWSVRNIQRAERLVAEGRMTPAGQQRIDEARANGQWQAAIEREQVQVIPIQLEEALNAHPGTYAAFQALPGSRKKQYLYWLQSAKRDETKRQRIEKILQELRKR